MTIAKTTSRTSFAGDDSTVAFSYPYRFFAETDLVVTITNDTTEVVTTQTLTTDYSVSNNGDETGGTVTMVTAPAVGETLTIYRRLQRVQSTDYQSNDAFPSETHEEALDRLTLMIQDLVDLLTAEALSDLVLSAVQPADDLLTSIAALTFGANSYIYGTGSDTAAAGTITSVSRTLLALSSAASWRASLETPYSREDLYTGDLDSIATTAGLRFVRVGTGATNHWDTVADGDLVRENRADANNAVQWGYSLGGYSTLRIQSSGSWGSWVPNATRNNAVVADAADLPPSAARRDVCFGYVDDGSSGGFNAAVEKGCTITRSGTGFYDVAFTNERSDTNYMVLCTPERGTSPSVVFRVVDSTKATTGFQLNFRSTGDNSVQDTAFMFEVRELR